MVFKKIIFQNRYVALETPSRLPRFMANTILNFHFDYWNPSLTRQLSCSPQRAWIYIWHTTRTSHLWKAEFDFCLYCFNNDIFSLDPSPPSSSKFILLHFQYKESFATRLTLTADNSNIIFSFFVDRNVSKCLDGLKRQIAVSVQTSQIGLMWVKTKKQSIHKGQNYPKRP